MDLSTDTIVAVASPPGRAGVGVIRLSGPKAYEMALRLSRQPSLMPRMAKYSVWRDEAAQMLDSGISLFFQAPHSFTGEDVVELQGHASPLVQDALLQALLALGARMAEPGEFSRRAFLNDKIDLAQAEAIADLINAQSRQAVQSAFRSLDGVFSDEVHRLVEALIQLRVFVEATLDFPEEEIDFLAESDVADRLARLLEQLSTLLNTAEQGRLLQEGLKVVLVGEPNAGKSSLLNCLAGSEEAIVTDIPGTTRDLLHVNINLDGVCIRLTDTAGLRETDDVVEREGVRRARQALRDADVILHLTDIRVPYQTLDLPSQAKVLTAFSKVDLVSEPDLPEGAIGLSVKRDGGLDALKQQIKMLAGLEDNTEGVFIARRRHVDALNQAQMHLQQAQEQLYAQASELLAEELTLAQNQLSRITGRFSSDDLLGEIFSSFCIGK